MKVISMLKPYRLPFFIALFFLLAELAAELVQPLLIAKVIDEGIMQKDVHAIFFWGAIMMVVALFAFCGGIINSFFATHVSQSFGYDVRRALFTKIQFFSLANFNRYPTSSLITRSTNDVTQIQNTVYMTLRIMLRAPLFVMGGLVLALLVNVRLALFLVVAAPLSFFFLRWVMKKGNAVFRALQTGLDKVNGVMRENLSGIRIIKAFQRSTYERKRFSNVNEQLKDNTMKGLRLMEATTPVLLVIMNAAILCILWFGNLQIQAGSTQVGDLVAIINYSMRITAIFGLFSWIMMTFSRAKASSERINEVLGADVDLTEKEQKTAELPTASGSILFDNVSFSYPGSSKQVLSQFSFAVSNRETIAVMGATGAGKTSLFQLIPRLYEATNGNILVGGVDVKKLPPRILRKQIGFVPQDPLLFTGTVQENILWGKENATEEEVREACRRAQILETIDALPQGFQTKIGQKGVNLSGGQKQRLSIARALVRKPAILLLDDSTSALDLQTEHRLLEALREIHVTTLIITQKVATSKRADRILLLEDGKLLAQGSHDSLLQRSSLYKHICESQLGKELTQDV
ncbi:multidrug ABC transporter ATP-binding protein/permease [Fictibacillus macauensis ZFHKF-1]|uniref:Multidrug ABC transporter ATP-binding protein/permease n=1 Tax=Fictibacillus macauensis ZFHKF-1 TaxID=1196324 RepID=I8AGD7_9BACL|nr:ABC transporter ATP-binding protein [Fictibacillus macauensis]EIT84747.1 multidrug ABC transporter ATP-binding protein/permease [Fictibacillus macauensis ZFHKF-1]